MEASYYDAYQAAVYAAASSTQQDPQEEENEEWEDENDGKFSRKGNVSAFHKKKHLVK